MAPNTSVSAGIWKLLSLAQRGMGSCIIQLDLTARETRIPRQGSRVIFNLLSDDLIDALNAEKTSVE